MSAQEAPVGAKVEVAAGVGIVRWTGSNPPFAAGKWVGVELLDGGGKNDGSVKGERYFQCQPGYGVFVRPSQVKILEVPAAATTPRATPRPSAARPAGVAPAMSRTSSTASRVPSPPKARPSGVPTPTPSTPSRTASSSSIAVTPSTIRRPSIAGPSNAMPPPSTIPRPTSAASTATSIRRPSSTVGDAGPSRIPRPSSVASTVIDEEPQAGPSSRAVSPVGSVAAPRRAVSPTKAIPAPVRSGPQMRSLSSAIAADRPAPTETASTAESAPRSKSPDATSSGEAFAAKRETDELRIKVRQLEQRKVEDQERIRGLEGKATELETMRAARVKLQAKFQELQGALMAAQRQSKDFASENALLETRVADALDQLEMAALDREVAEEKAESVEGEVERLNEKVAELEMEVALLKEENAEYEKPVEGGDGARTSHAYVQLEKHNERLKEALIRLRDMTSENEREHKTKVSDLERDLAARQDLSGELQLVQAKYTNAETQIEDLKMQLDDALGAEDMLEQLTERNLHMSERIEEMRATIEDLEALKELNDELEEGHVESERQLNAEIDELGAQLRDERARVDELDTLVHDMEGTIGQFRELVSVLQAENDELRDQHVEVQHETAATSKEAHALMNLNMKLQTSASKAQNKTIELELKKLEVAQLSQHLRIVSAYLPETFSETDADPTALYLFFQRISAKIDLLASSIGTLHNLPGALQQAQSEALVGACELRGKLRHFSVLGRRFGGVLLRCTPDEWMDLGKRVLPEMSGVEARVDAWVGALRDDGFSEMECAKELASLINQFNHLAATTLCRPELDLAEQQLGHAYNVDCDLDNFAAAVGFARQAVAGLAGDDEIEVIVGDSSLEAGVYEPVQVLLDLVKGVKGPSTKLVAEIESLAEQGLALPAEVLEQLSGLAGSVSDAVDLAVKRIGAHAASLRSSKDALRLADVDRFLLEVTAQSAAPPDLPPWDIIGAFITRLGTQIGQVLPLIRHAVKSGHTSSVTTPPPWTARVDALRAASAASADTERQLVRFTEENKDLMREVKLRDQTLQEAGVKVETLERRLEASRKQADAMLELENDVAKAKKLEKVYEDAIEQLQGELEGLEKENAGLTKGVGAGGSGIGDGAKGHAERLANASAGDAGLLIPSSSSAEAGQLAEQVESLRAAIRHLRNENALLRAKDVHLAVHRLPRLRYGGLAAAGAPSALLPLRIGADGAGAGTDGVPELDESLPDSPSSLSGSEAGDGADWPRTPSSPSTSTSRRETRQALETEGRVLRRRVAQFRALPRVVDLSCVGGPGLGYEGLKGGAIVGEDAGAGEGRLRVQRKRAEPEMQMWEWDRCERELGRAVRDLGERVERFQFRMGRSR